MPFDATTFETDALAMLGIVPVSAVLVEQHKTKVLDTYLQRHKHDENVISGSVKWASHKIRPGELHFTLTHPRRTFAFNSPSRSRAPANLVTLAEHVEGRLKNAVFSIDYFYTDPVLNVHYDGKAACLGIWEGRKIVAMATHPFRLPTRWQRLLQIVAPRRWR